MTEREIADWGLNMTEREIADWGREFEHVESKQKQSRKVTFAGGHSYEVPEAIYSNDIYQVKESESEN